ncbi:hypothetical protein GMRT_12245 [Giardia muris]|uniref:Uncharacterized protein n=1 Tax=Giardia muris TaxID=5742 RepID=A0A4Z1SYQ3_GIAMU|nr:hypothetical protein GMRT_12245 [Giardia muris]|eukprot:TNJ30600.1 hypothetical protein GMRT_12245 [Giardia muris]
MNSDRVSLSHDTLPADSGEDSEVVQSYSLSGNLACSGSAITNSHADRYNTLLTKPRFTASDYIASEHDLSPEAAEFRRNLLEDVPSNYLETTGYSRKPDLDAIKRDMDGERRINRSDFPDPSVYGTRMGPSLLAVSRIDEPEEAIRDMKSCIEKLEKETTLTEVLKFSEDQIDGCLSNIINSPVLCKSATGVLDNFLLPEVRVERDGTICVDEVHANGNTPSIPMARKAHFNPMTTDSIDGSDTGTTYLTEALQSDDFRDDTLGFVQRSPDAGTPPHLRSTSSLRNNRVNMTKDLSLSNLNTVVADSYHGPPHLPLAAPTWFNIARQSQSTANTSSQRMNAILAPVSSATHTKDAQALNLLQYELTNRIKKCIDAYTDLLIDGSGRSTIGSHQALTPGGVALETIRTAEAIRERSTKAALNSLQRVDKDKDNLTGPTAAVPNLVGRLEMCRLATRCATAAEAPGDMLRASSALLRTRRASTDGSKCYNAWINESAIGRCKENDMGSRIALKLSVQDKLCLKALEQPVTAVVIGWSAFSCMRKLASIMYNSDDVRLLVLTERTRRFLGYLSVSNNRVSKTPLDQVQLQRQYGVSRADVHAIAASDMTQAIEFIGPDASFALVMDEENANLWCTCLSRVLH